MAIQTPIVNQIECIRIMRLKDYFLFAFFLSLTLVTQGQQAGDSLALLYRRVYVYGNPDDFSTRLQDSPYSYYNNKKFTFISVDENGNKVPHGLVLDEAKDEEELEIRERAKKL